MIVLPPKTFASRGLLSMKNAIDRRQLLTGVSGLAGLVMAKSVMGDKTSALTPERIETLLAPEPMVSEEAFDGAALGPEFPILNVLSIEVDWQDASIAIETNAQMTLRSVPQTGLTMAKAR